MPSAYQTIMPSFLYSTSCSCLYVNKEEATGKDHFTIMDGLSRTNRW